MSSIQVVWPFEELLPTPVNNTKCNTGQYKYWGGVLHHVWSRDESLICPLIVWSSHLCSWAGSTGYPGWRSRSRSHTWGHRTGSGGWRERRCLRCSPETKQADTCSCFLCLNIQSCRGCGADSQRYVRWRMGALTCTGVCDLDHPPQCAGNICKAIEAVHQQEHKETHWYAFRMGALLRFCTPF